MNCIIAVTYACEISTVRKRERNRQTKKTEISSQTRRQQTERYAYTHIQSDTQIVRFGQRQVIQTDRQTSDTDRQTDRQMDK